MDHQMDQLSVNMNKNLTMTAVLALSATQAYADTCYALAFSSGD